nr:ferredoxin [uncultured Cellulosilyticum sp.]
MKAYVDRDTCVGCGTCVGICPEVFGLDDENKSVPSEEELEGDKLDGAKEAEGSCPVDAISVK